MDSNLVRQENERPGTSEWMLARTRFDSIQRYRCPFIEGYCSRASLRAGEKMSIFVSTNPPSCFKIDFYRTGYYGGAGARHVGSTGPFEGHVQGEPPSGPNRLRECQWKESAQVTIPSDWLSGVYLGKLTAEESGIQSYVIFIVRDDRKADYIFKCSDTTWHAYNRWPHWHSMYDTDQTVWNSGPNVEVSLDRPITKYCTILESNDGPNTTDWHDAPLAVGSAEWLLWEYPVAFWMEAHGYDVTYISSIDAHADSSGLLRGKGIFSVGHDEYYTLEMYNNLKAAVDNGVSMAFLSGNSCNGVIQLRPNAAGVPHRRITRIDYFGPRNEETCKRFPGMEKMPYNSPNENLLIGARNSFPITGGADWICSKPGHWLYESTGMKSGDRIPGMIGWEWHGSPAEIPGLEVVATGKTQNTAGQEGMYTATVYPGPKGNIVFNASTIWWGDGLSQPPGYKRPGVYTSPRGPDKRVQRMMANIMNRMAQQ